MTTDTPPLAAGTLPESSGAATILAVDNTPESYALLVETLSREGYQVCSSDSVESALAVVAAHPPDLILLDVHYGGKVGLEVCCRLKQREETWHIPIILISEVAEAKEWAQCVQLGAADYIAKPFQAEELLACIRKHLAHGNMNASFEQQYTSLRQANERLQREVTGLQVVEAELRQGMEKADRTHRSMLRTVPATQGRHAKGARHE